MKVIKAAILAFVLSCIVETVPVWGIMVTPSNVVLPTSPGELLSFDLVISSSDPTGINAALFQCTIGVSSAGLTFDADNSEAVIDDLGYWIYDNSSGVYAEILGSNNYRFSDSPGFPLTETLLFGDTVARFAFTWDGVVTNYTFTLDLNTNNSYVRLGNFVTKEALQFDPGDYPGDDDSFTITIPEPTTICCLLGLGTLALLRKRRV